LPPDAFNSDSRNINTITDNSSVNGKAPVTGNSNLTINNGLYGNSRSTANSITLNIYNLQGSLVYQSIMIGDENIPVHQLIPGMYLIQVQIPGVGPYNTKLLITR
jgi:hypothetical protein